MNSPPRIRDVQHADLDGIVALHALRSGAAKRDYWAGVLSEYRRGGPQTERVALAVSGEDGQVEGFLFGEIRAWEFGSERCGWIFSVAVHPRWERLGLASLLCREAEQRFATMGVSLVRTMVRRNDVPVLSLFRSMGFVGGPFSELEKPLPAVVASEEGAA
jgi:ribosomal protein S18 acetylase RimI-like enzyme